VVLGFLIDLSNSNRLHWDKFKEAIQDLVLATMEPEGKPDERFSAYLIGYSTEAELLVNTTNTPEPLLDRVRKVKPGGGSALYDALYMACTSRTLVKGEPLEPRRVIIIVGDGRNNAGKKGLEEVLEIAQRNLVTIYGVSTTAFGFHSEGDSNLKRLAESTGGRVVYPLEDVYSDVAGYLSKPSDEGNYAIKVGTGGYAASIMKGIVNAIQATAGEINTQYILRYVPTESDVTRAFRRISVMVNVPNAKVRARERVLSLTGTINPSNGRQSVRRYGQMGLAQSTALAELRVFEALGENCGVALIHVESGEAVFRFRQDWDEFAGEEADVLRAIAEDLPGKLDEMGPRAFLDWVDGTFSNTFRVLEPRTTLIAQIDRRPTFFTESLCRPPCGPSGRICPCSSCGRPAVRFRPIWR
jgi:hypothetical protein